jgi:hypothetical protein
MQRRLRVCDVPAVLLGWAERAGHARQMRWRRHRASHHRPGSLTYQRQQALARWLAEQRRGDP